MTAVRPDVPSGVRLVAVGRYLLLVSIANLAWELAQLPFYTLWRKGTAGEIAFAVVHCTAGDVLIAGSVLGLALLLLGEPGWPETGFARVAATATLVGLGYTVWSEWLNTAVRGSWAYADAMPVLPPLGTGLLPLLQWLLLPPACLLLARRTRTTTPQGMSA